VFVDKTGTLTEGRMQLVGVEPAEGGLPLDRLKTLAASLAAWSTHPLSVALREAVDAPSTVWREVREQPGAGIEGVDAAGQRWRLGSARWAAPTHAADDAEAGSATVWLGRDGLGHAAFRFEERVRADAADAVRALRADGVKVRLLSGDAPARAGRVAALLGLDDACGGLDPDAKLNVLRAAQQRGEIVAMIGDGINDAPVLAQADVSLAMGEGALIARAEADGVLVSNRLGDLARARTLAKKALRVVRQNLVWAALYNAACVPLALIGWLPPWLAGAGMATSSLVVVINSLRLSRGTDA
jgi:Cu2+-exporting ATPase